MSWIIGILANGPHSSVIQDDGRIVNKYQRTYLMMTDGPVPTEAAITTALGIDPGSPYENDLNATCRAITSIDQRPTREPYITFEVGVEWSTNAPLPNEVSTDPTTGRVIWSLRPTIQTRYITEDRDGDLIVNSAGQPYDGGVPVAVRLGTAIARRKRNAIGYDRDAALANSGKLNTVTYLGGAPGTVQVDIESDERYEGGYHFWEEVYTFNYDKLGWQPKPPDVGFFQKGLIDGIVVPITVGDLSDPPTADDTRVQEPEALDGAGHVVPYANRPEDCAFNTVLHFEEMDFADFALT